MKTFVIHKILVNLFIVAVLFFSPGCSKPVVQTDESIGPAASSPSSMKGNLVVLAGEWEYEDGVVVPITLDEQGNGTYPWKEGRFETVSLSDHTWNGRWIQEENDREGGFTVEFSRDFSKGEGRWWYTRIEANHKPTQPGGTFHLLRISSQTVANESPQTP